MAGKLYGALWSLRAGTGAAWNELIHAYVDKGSDMDVSCHYFDSPVFTVSMSPDERLAAVKNLIEKYEKTGKTGRGTYIVH